MIELRLFNFDDECIQINPLMIVSVLTKDRATTVSMANGEIFKVCETASEIWEMVKGQYGF